MNGTGVFKVPGMEQEKDSNDARENIDELFFFQKRIIKEESK